MPFKNPFAKPEDCIIGEDFTGLSYKKPRWINSESKVDLDSMAECCIDAIAKRKNDLNRIKTQLINHSFVPHHDLGDYIKGSTIQVKNAYIKEQAREKKASLKSGHHRHFCKLCCEGALAVGFVLSSAFMNQRVSLSHPIRVNEVIKIIE